MPMLNHVVITDTRIVGVSKDLYGNFKFSKEAIGSEVVGVSTGEPSKLTSYTSLSLTGKNGKKSKFTDIHNTDAVEATNLLTNIIGKGSPTSVTAQLKQQAIQLKNDKKQAKTDAKQLAIDRAKSGQCPKCGSDKLQAVHTSSQKGFSDASALGGCCLFGPLGLLCGLCGSGKKQESSFRMCLNCGNKF